MPALLGFVLCRRLLHTIVCPFSHTKSVVQELDMGASILLQAPLVVWTVVHLYFPVRWDPEIWLESIPPMVGPKWRDGGHDT